MAKHLKIGSYQCWGSGTSTCCQKKQADQQTADGFYNFLLINQHKLLTFSANSVWIIFDLCSAYGPRLVHSGSGCRSPSLGSDLTFATRTGSRQGIEMHLFRVETHRDLSTWTRILVQGCHAAAELIKEVSLGIDSGTSFLIIIKWNCYTLFFSWTHLHHSVQHDSFTVHYLNLYSIVQGLIY